MASMLDCEKVRPQLSEFVDGDLSGDNAWAIKLHIASCAVCSQVVSEFTQVSTLLRNLPERELSMDFESALSRRLADQVLKPKRMALFEKLSDWWTQPRLRPAFASIGALAAVVPVCFVIAYRSGEMASVKAAGALGTAQATHGITDPGLDEAWSEHLSYSSSEPLADSSGILQAQTGAPVLGAASNIAGNAGDTTL